MTAVETLTTLHRLGVTLTPWVDRLRVDAPQNALTPALRAALREHKAELLDLGTGVEAVAAGAPLGLHEAVALLPVADRRGADAQHALHGADAIDGKVPVRQEGGSLSHRNPTRKVHQRSNSTGIPHQIHHHLGLDPRRPG